MEGIMTARKLAEHIDVDMNTKRVTIDGQPFGYYVALEPITVEVGQDQLGSVTFTVLANRVTVTDRLAPTLPAFTIPQIIDFMAAAPGRRTVLVAHTLDLARAIMQDLARQAIAGHGDSAVETRWTHGREQLDLSNGSSLTLDSEHAERIRGVSADLVLIDETVSADLTEKITPAVMSTNGTIASLTSRTTPAIIRPDFG
jgi:hypothetical protein